MKVTWVTHRARLQPVSQRFRWLNGAGSEGARGKKGVFLPNFSALQRVGISGLHRPARVGRPSRRRWAWGKRATSRNVAQGVRMQKFSRLLPGLIVAGLIAVSAAMGAMGGARAATIGGAAPLG